MKEYTIGEKGAGQKLHRFAARVLKEAPASFCYKMLRKKNIVLNGKKASGNEVLEAGDRITFYLSDETFAKFAGKAASIPEAEPWVTGEAKETKTAEEIKTTGAAKETKAAGAARAAEETKAAKAKKKQLAGMNIPIIYEDANILIYNKPAGVLSQKAEAGDVSVNEYFIAYLLQSGQLSRQELEVFRPSVCNRLDRNTSGLILCGKTMLGLRTMSRLLKERSLRKEYLCIVLGTLEEGFVLHGYLRKEERTNKVTVVDTPGEGISEIHTEVTPLESFRAVPGGKELALSLLNIHLITGKTHQIRAHLASVGHPVIGDYKYGSRPVNDLFKRYCGIESQLLHALRVRFPELDGELAGLSGRSFEAPLPEAFGRVKENSLMKM